MDFYTLNGRIKQRSITDYLVQWDGPSRSKFQKAVKTFLRPYWKNTNVVLEEFPCLGTRLSLDFLNISAKLAIEVQGEQHQNTTAGGDKLHFFFNGRPGAYRAQMKRDLQKIAWCEKNSFRLIEIFPEDMPLSAKLFRDKYGITL